MTRKTETDFIKSIDQAIVQAGELMSMNDVNYDDDEDAYDQIYEQRFHCGTCVVNSVFEVVWPSINDYIMFLSSKTD